MTAPAIANGSVIRFRKRRGGPRLTVRVYSVRVSKVTGAQVIYGDRVTPTAPHTATHQHSGSWVFAGDTTTWDYDLEVLAEAVS